LPDDDGEEIFAGLATAGGGLDEETCEPRALCGMVARHGVPRGRIVALDLDARLTGCSACSIWLVDQLM
jgi:hypothetical protein